MLKRLQQRRILSSLAIPSKGTWFTVKGHHKNYCWILYHDGIKIQQNGGYSDMSIAFDDAKSAKRKYMQTHS